MTVLTILVLQSFFLIFKTKIIYVKILLFPHPKLDKKFKHPSKFGSNLKSEKCNIEYFHKAFNKHKRNPITKLFSRSFETVDYIEIRLNVMVTTHIKLFVYD